MIRFTFIAMLTLSCLSAEAFHIVGGEITYERQGNDAYEVTLTVYRDCFSAGAAFDDPAAIGVFEGDGTFFDVFSFDNPTITPVSTTVDFDCVDINASACVEKGVYVQVIFLPPNETGYFVAYQRCCRNTTIQNLVTPEEFGATYAAFIPSQNIFPINSSPQFIGLPPVGLCQGLPFSFDHSATDLDGDSLVYELCTPYHGASQDDPQPGIPSAPPWSSVVWGAGFSATNQITANPIFTIDSVTGLLEGTPDQIGQYVMGVCVKEYRNGALVSEVRRDFQFNVVACPSAVLASFVDISQGVFCEGAEIQFANQSANADEFFWTFGDGMTSNEEEPTHIFTSVGEFTVTLISQPGDICADTAITTYTIHPNPAPEIMEPTLNCPGNTYDILVGGDLLDVDSYAWTIASPAGPDFNDGPLLTEIGFTSSGLTYIDITVTNSGGCTGEDTYLFTVPDPPVAAIAPITDPCQGLEISFLSESQFDQGLLWDFGGSGNATNDDVANPVFTYDNSGAYTVTLVASSPVACDDVASISIDVNPALNVAFEVPGPQCLEGNSFDFVGTGNFTSNAVFSWVFDGSDLPTLSTQSALGVSFPEQGAYEIMYMVTEGPCESVQWGNIDVVEALDVDFVTASQGCAPHDANFVSLTSGGAALEYTWLFGDETSSNFPGSVSHTYLQPGVYDVSLTVASTFGCIDEETVSIPDAISVAPSPTANFIMNPPFADINQSFVNVTSTAVGGTECIYLIEDHPSISDCDFTFEFLVGGEYDITQVVSNEFGCEDRVTAPFKITGHAFYAPNAITLNQDGINDFFVPVVTGDIVEYNMKIYDRWGTIIFESETVGEPWVPEYAHVGMHSYRVTLRDNANFRQIYDGVFNLLR